MPEAPGLEPDLGTPTWPAAFLWFRGQPEAKDHNKPPLPLHALKSGLDTATEGLLCSR